jgi:steroid delta-isomerase
MSEVHPAIQASRNSWRCVMAKDKQGWLDLMAEDICVEDPIGVAPTNPDGKGVRGKAALSEFYDKNMASSTIEIETHESYAADNDKNESAHLMTLRTTLSNGMKVIVRGIFTYRINDEGKITNLRGFWSLSGSEFVQPAS